MEKVLIEEQSAYGAAILAGAGIGIFNVEQGARDWKKLSGRTEPNMKAHAQYQELLPVFRELYQKTRSLSKLD